MSAIPFIRELLDLKADVSLSMLVDEMGATDSSRSKKSVIPKSSCSGVQGKKRNIKQFLQKTKWTSEEDNAIRDNHADLGMRWSQYTILLPGRSENAIHSRCRELYRKKYYSIGSSDSSDSSDSCIIPAKRPFRNKAKRCHPDVPSKNLTNSTIGREVTQEQKISRLQELLAARRKLDFKILELEENLSSSSSSDYF